MLVGYIWVESGDDESLLSRQRQALQHAGVAAAHLYEDINCERHAPRPKRQSCLDSLKSGDVLVIWQLERLIDSRAHLLDVLRHLQQGDIGLNVLTGAGAVMNSAHVSLNVIINILESVAELEERIISESTIAGLAAARAKGQTLGAKPKMTPAVLRQIMEDIVRSDASFTAIAEKHGLTRATLYNYLNGDGSLKPLGLKLLRLDEDK